MVCWLVVWLRGSLSLLRVFGVRFVVVGGCAEFVLAGLVGSGGSGLRGRRRSMALSGRHFQETNKKVGRCWLPTPPYSLLKTAAYSLAPSQRIFRSSVGRLRGTDSVGPQRTCSLAALAYPGAVVAQEQWSR